MKKLTFTLALLACSALQTQAQNTFEGQFTRPLGEVLDEIATRFNVRLKYDIDTTGLKLPYADSRIRPYSVEESLTNVLSPFDYKFVKQGNALYKLKKYEYPRRTDADGRKLIDYLLTQYNDQVSFEKRRVLLKKEVRERLQIDKYLSQRTGSAPILSKVRKYDGYTVQNFALETLPGLYVCGSIYTPKSKGKHALIICPNGHFGDGRYREDQQQRMATLARMGAICVDYDLFGWGESVYQVSSAGHHTSVAHIVQAMNGISILDYMMTRKDVDTTRVGVNGGSGGGSQTVLLSVLDDRYTASCPVVSLASHFDGGCPCESGMPIMLAGGGTCNAELGALFAPKPMCVVSDGKDWTASTPTLEYPYLQKVYGFYGAADKVTNVHLPKEGHDFGPNKRNAVYDFFAGVFNLDKSKLDESKVTIEPFENLYSFGKKGEKMPENAIRSVNELGKYFGKDAVRAAAADESVLKKSQEIIAALNLTDEKVINLATTAVYNHRRAVRDWHNAHPYTIIPEVDKATGRKLSKVEREMMADRMIPESVHARLLKDLNRVLTPEQVEAVFDQYTVGKVAFTMKGYYAIVPDLTDKEAKVIEGHLKQAREEALECKSMKAISQVFEIYKTKCEQYLNSNGRDWKQLFRDYVNKRKAEKAAQKAKEAKK